MTAIDTAPRRIQRRRTKGWRAPVGARYVGRPTKYANPFNWTTYPKWFTDACGEPLDEPIRISDAQRRLHAATDFRAAMLYDLNYGGITGYPTPAEIRADLAGQDLMCWCPLTDEHGAPVLCHADVLLVIANNPDGAR